jgi:hypothetical protein
MIDAVVVVQVMRMSLWSVMSVILVPVMRVSVLVVMSVISVIGVTCVTRGVCYRVLRCYGFMRRSVWRSGAGRSSAMRRRY